ncbi:cell envelope-related function transcriptional attenuator common domain-containing protein [Corynebacterium mycetoides]|uniref:Cell envelope-related function transcriptional attenuator common domain-containing protein n=1 Tax=Corynebacterium mycetoides TaxID=38302 RepID=A0A1G9PJQ7_9CORY|nr:LCP family protein [Corynebacterium mycetoides]SDL98447.1 cell envelope-related function transcriptional attenuator common domain-containing protein [Corynebacterium mycetoides]
MPTTPHSNDPRDNLGDYLLGKDGKPIVDRYGRPVRRRAARVERVERPVERPADRPVERPRQYVPPQETRQYEPRRTPQRPANTQRPPVRRPRRAEPAPMAVSRSRVAAPAPAPVARRRRKAPGCVAVLALLLVIVVAAVLLADARLNRVDALPDQRIGNTAGTNWLLVGSDSRSGLSEEDIARYGTGGDLGVGRTDTVMLLHLPLSGPATLVSIPRDSYVEVPGYGMDKINAAFAYGGPKLLAETVEHNTGLRVDRYMEIGMGGLAGVVDAIGGVEICVVEPIDDPLANLNVAPGCQMMDGATGLGYVRTRATALGDLDRVGRQREFLSAVVDKVTSPAVLANPFRVIPLIWAAPELFTVNKNDHIWNLARVALAMRGGLQTETVPLGGFADTEVGNVMLWDDAGAEALFASLR